ncbi:MAG: L-serine ammonia-lyase [Bacteroidota bacterium]
MECVSVFDMLKIGVGPSSSHTLGSWRAAEEWVEELEKKEVLTAICKVDVLLYGSLSLTGKGHATDIAIVLGLLGQNPETIPTAKIDGVIAQVKHQKVILLGGKQILSFDFDTNIIFKKKILSFHANGIRFEATMKNGKTLQETYYSIGGGFIVKEELQHYSGNNEALKRFPYPITTGTELLSHCRKQDECISAIVLLNEHSLRKDNVIDVELKRIWNTMLNSMYLGCHTEGILPGGLNVRRRAFDMHEKLKGESYYSNPQEWLETIRETKVEFRQIIKWVCCFALAVNEVNASLGRVVTAPTNGSTGVIPSVLMYYLVIENHDGDFDDIKKNLLVAGEIGSIFKKGATISAAMGGCQAEIGVSSAMAAGALTELMDGTPEQVLVAAEIAMERHLGLTCDPMGGLVQIPCIERNCMGAMKAINAAELAMDTNPDTAKVPLDKVVQTMWETAKDMNSKYKETSEGGLAIRVNISDC